MPLHPLPLVASGQTQADEWALALASAGVSSQIEADRHGWHLLVGLRLAAGDQRQRVKRHPRRE